MVAHTIDVLKEIAHWSSYDVFRLVSSLGRQLESPERVLGVKRHLRIGQQVTYYVPEQDRALKATLVKFLRSRAVVEDRESGKKWSIPYCAIDTDYQRRTPYQIHTSATANSVATSSLSRASSSTPKPSVPSVSVGDAVWFSDHQQKQHGKVVRLNERTATVTCKGAYWRVPYHSVFVEERLVTENTILTKDLLVTEAEDLS